VVNLPISYCFFAFLLEISYEICCILGGGGGGLNWL